MSAWAEGETMHDYLPAPNNQSEGIQVACVGRPMGGCHSIIIGCIALLPSGVSQQVEISIAHSLTYSLGTAVAAHLDCRVGRD